MLENWGREERGNVRCYPPLLPPPAPGFLMEIIFPLHQLMTSPKLIRWREVANIKYMCFVFTSDLKVATSHSL